MPSRGLGPVRPTEMVPPGERETKVAVRLGAPVRVMNTVHVRGDDEEPQDTIEAERETEIGVIEQRPCIQKRLEQEYGYWWRPEGNDGRELDQQGEKDLDRMEPRSRRDVHIDVGMVHAVHTPQDGHSVTQHTLQIDGEV